LFSALQTLEHRRGERLARRDARGSRLVVLAYHAIADLSRDPVLAEYGVPPARFAEQLDLLLREGWTFVSVETLVRALDGQEGLPRRSAVVTFDDGYSDLLTTAYPLLRERGIPAVVFVVAGSIGQTNTWDEPLGASTLPLLHEGALRTLAAGGVAVGSHGLEHRRLVGLDPGELAAELRESADRIEAVVGARPVAFSYPHGVWSAEIASAAREAGYAVAFTADPGVVAGNLSAFRGRHAMPRVEVLASDTPSMLRLKTAMAGWPEPRGRRLLRLLRKR
jgi:peptidoglycan/xylan/chitin deacetylase (PgdA/CDA1 family)